VPFVARATTPPFDSGSDLRDTGVVKIVAEVQGTRERVRSLLLALGPSTAATLSERLGLSPAAIRKHLDALVADGTVTTRDPRPVRGLRGRGRPARLYALTDAGHAVGPAAYDDLAAGALRFLAEQAGESAVERFAQARVAELEQRYAERMRETPRAQRPAVLAEALSQDGYAATTSEHGLGVQLCQHHCPVQNVAAEFPQLCDAETAALGRLLDVHVQRLATIAHGDGVCTTFIPSGKAPR
jgi:predicted ArsR family transcriptional regulator